MAFWLQPVIYAEIDPRRALVRAGAGPLGYERDMPVGRLTVLTVLVLASCTPGGEDGARGPARPQPSPLVSELPDRCGSIGRPPSGAQISFVAQGNLYLATADGRRVRCATSAEGVSQLEWGAGADRVLLAGLDRHVAEGTASEVILSSESASVTTSTWSRPTGTSIVYIQEGRLLKVGARESEPRDISFLERHESVVYHPAGTHIVSTGIEAQGGDVGLFLATNEGTDARRLVRNETASSIDGLAFSHDGETLYFSADHGQRHDLHALSLAPGNETGDTESALAEMELETVHESRHPISDVVVSELDGRSVAFRTGSCDAGFKTYSTAPDGDRDDFFALDEEIYGSFNEPVGWTPDGELIVLVRDGCDGSGDLYRTQAHRGILFAQGVTLASVRAELPPPPDPPLPAQEVPA